MNPTERTEWLLLTTSNDMLAEQLTDMEDGCRSITHEFKNRSECLCLSCPTTSSGRGPWIDESTLVVNTAVYLTRGGLDEGGGEKDIELERVSGLPSRCQEFGSGN